MFTRQLSTAASTKIRPYDTSPFHSCVQAETTYFCDAYASWQKRGIENDNSHIRRWLPRGIDLDDISDEAIQEIAMTYCA